MSTSTNKYDTIESIIYDEGLRISTIDFHRGLDLMLVVLNTGAILHQKISNHSSLKNATDEQLNKFELIGKGIGVHWPLIDEDLSLKGFLKDELMSVVKNGRNPLAA